MGTPPQAMTSALPMGRAGDSRVTSLVDALMEDGFVERRPHHSDGCSTVVSLTTAGADQQKLSWQQHQHDIGKVFGDLPVELQQQLQTITPLLTEAIRTRTAERITD